MTKTTINMNTMKTAMMKTAIAPVNSQGGLKKNIFVKPMDSESASRLVDQKMKI